jgi:uncharacterized protein YjbJ (UPF0337 family)
MVNAQILQGHWNEIKGVLKQHWGDLTGDDLRRFSGDVDQLVGLIQRKTGATRRAIQNFLEEITTDAAESVSTAVENGRASAEHASLNARQTFENVAKQIRDRYSDAAEVVRVRPAESVLFAFGAGLFTGVIVGLTMRKR